MLPYTDGADIAVTKQNRQKYVDLYLEWILNKSIYQAFRAFYHGFHSVCASNALLVRDLIDFYWLMLNKLTKQLMLEHGFSGTKVFWNT